MELPGLEAVDLNGKRVFVRCDFDVPLEGSAISDDSRLISSISTIEFLLESGAHVVAVGHMGRPTKFEPKLSLKLVAEWFSEQFPGSHLEEQQIGNFKAFKIKEDFIILENLRFYEGEEKNDHVFAKELAALSDIYVNEAFGSSHRPHASIVGVPSLLPHFAGFHLAKEIKILSTILENPKRPLTVIVGGAKIETKLPLVSKMHHFADYVLVGGQVAQDEILIKEQHEEIVGQKALLLVADSNSEKTDITTKSLENFIQVVSRSATIIWNGPMGQIEGGRDQSSLSIAEAISKSDAYKIVGGGDTIGFLNKKELVQKFDFVSVGGGAMLEFLAGVKLPGIEVLL